MKIEAKKNLLAASLYIALAVMIVTVMCVTVLSVAKKAKKVLPAPTEGTTEATEDKETKPATESTEPTPSTTEPTAVKPTEKPDEPADAPVADPMPDSFSVPTNGYVSKGYEAELPVWSVTMEDYRTHEGMDIVCDAEGEIYSCADGTVESIYEDPLMGHSITVYHGGGLRSTYMGLTEELPQSIKTGVQVSEGQVLGWVGESNLIECAEPKHLHFEMTLEDASVDPQNYIQFESATMNEYE